MTQSGDFDEESIERAVWDAFAALGAAAQADRRPRFSKDGPYYSIDGHEEQASVHARVAKAFGRAATQRGFAIDNAPFYFMESEVRRRVFSELVGMGFVVPGRPGQAIGFDPGSFTFSTRGLAYFGSRTQVALHDPTTFASRAEDLRKAGIIDDARKAVLLEAHRCWTQGSHRAAMILTGLACEEVALSVVRRLVLYQPRATGNQSKVQWSAIDDESKTFTARWNPAIQFMHGLKKWVRDTLGQAHAAWRRVEAHPDWLLPLGEAVRLARNEAAHTADRVPSSGDLTLLLSALPTQLEYLADLRDYLAKNPDNLTWPAL